MLEEQMQERYKKIMEGRNLKTLFKGKAILKEEGIAKCK